MQVIDGYREIVEASRPVQSIVYMNKIATNYMFKHKFSMASCIAPVSYTHL